MANRWGKYMEAEDRIEWEKQKQEDMQQYRGNENGEFSLRG